MPHPPLPTQVTRDLARLIESEALGVAFFATAAHLSVTEQERRAWGALRDLEIQTNAGVSSFVERAELLGGAKNRIASTAGFSGATGLRLVPFSTRLKVIRQGTKRYLPAFQRLAEHYTGTDDAMFFNYVVQHELAIISFTTRALAAERNALDPVLRLLDEPVPGMTTTA
jgi:hypothetical protein